MSELNQNPNTNPSSLPPVGGGFQPSPYGNSVPPQKGSNAGKVLLIIIGLIVALAIISTAVVLLFSFVNDNPIATTTTEMTQTNIATRPSTTDSEPLNIGKETESTETTKPKETDNVVVTPGKELTFNQIVKKVGPATVSILVEVPTAASDQWSSLFPEGENGSGLEQGSGSGFIISEDGYIVTNDHVITGAQTIHVLIPGYDEPVEAKLVGTDPKTDTSVLKVEEKGLPVVQLGDSGQVEVGDSVAAIGNPFGELEGTITSGIISALDRKITVGSVTYHLIQTDAAINFGNSGGPLVNRFGEVIGITNAKVAQGEGLGFAIPINDVVAIIEDLIDKGYVSGRPAIGIMGMSVDQQVSELYDIPLGVYVQTVVKGSAAEKAGILERDIIVKANGQEITTIEEIVTMKDKMAVGETMELEVYRSDEKKNVTIKLVLQEELPS